MLLIKIGVDYMEWLISFCMDNIIWISTIMMFTVYIHAIYSAIKDVDK